MHIRDDFQGGAPISQIPVAWFNSVAKFINSIIGGKNITFNKHDDGTESVIALNGVEPCPIDTSSESSVIVASRHPKEVLEIPDDESSSQKQIREIEDIGTSDYLARADHQHRLESIMTETEAENVSDGYTATSAAAALPLMKVEEDASTQKCTIYYRQPVVDKAGRITGLSDWVELCDVFMWSDI